MTQSWIQLPSDAANTGKQLQTFDNTIVATDVYAEAVVTVNSLGVEEGTSANPVRIDPTGTTTQPVSGTVVMDGDGTSNAASVVWNVSTGVLNAAISLVNNSFQYNYVNVQLLQTTTITGGAVTFEASLDNSNWYTLPAFKIGSTVQTQATYVLVANTTIAFAFNISGWQYFRIRVSTAFAGTGQVTVGYAAASNGQFYNYAGESTFGSYLVVANNNGSGVADGTTALVMSNTGAGANGQQAVAVSVFTGAGTTTTVLQRTPAIFKGGQGGSAAGAFSVWQPQLTKKVRAMKYMLEVAEDATITSGPLPVNIGFRFGLARSLAATFNITRSGFFDYTHRVVVPATALATSFEGYASDWIDLGNGVYSVDAPGRSLFCGLQTPAGTTSVTPAWTLATTGQWEAGCCAFTTLGNKGIFRLVNAYNLTAGTSSAVSAGVGNGRGNLVVVITRTTNIAAGVPTVTITDTASNTWTNLTAINNVSDVGPTNGSSLQLSYCLAMAGTDALLGANAITSTTSTHLATTTSGIVLEYENMGGAIDATAQTTGTGNSTAPAATAFTPTSSGTLILSYMATGTAQATCPLLGSPFFAIQENGGTAVPCIAIGDNWGNGVLAAGLVNVLVVGTEE